MSSSSCLSNGGQPDSYTRDVSPGSGEQSGSMANLIPGVPVPIPSSTASAHGIYYYYPSGQETLPEEAGWSRLVPVQLLQEDQSRSNTYLAPMTVAQSNFSETVATDPWNEASIIGQESEYLSLKYGSPTSEFDNSPFTILSPASSAVWSSPDLPTSQAANQASEGCWAVLNPSTPSSLGGHSLANSASILSSYPARIESRSDCLAVSDTTHTGNLSCPHTPMMTTASPTLLPMSITSNDASRPSAHDTNEATMKTFAGDSSLSSCAGDTSLADTPYAQLIYRALMSRQDRCMSLQEIYQWFREHTNKPEGRGKGWQNSIRHNLSMNQGFVKYDQKEGTNPSHSDYSSVSTRRNDKQKRSTVWTLQDWAIRNGIQSTTRYRDARRRGETRHRSGAPQPRPTPSPAQSRDNPQSSGNAFGTNRMSLLSNGFQRHFQPPTRPPQPSHFNPRQTAAGEPHTAHSHARNLFQDPYFSQQNMGAHAAISQTQQPTTDISVQPCGMMIPPPGMIQRQLSNSPPSGIHYQVQSAGERASSVFLNSQFRGSYPYRASDVQLGYTPARNKNSQPRSPGGYEGEYHDGLYNWPVNQKF